MNYPPPEQPDTSELADRSRPSSRRGFCCGCLAAAAILTVAFVALLMMLFSSPGEVIEQGRHALHPNDTVQQATTQLTEAQLRAMRGVKPVVQIHLSDADVNAYLKEHREEIALPSGLKEPKVAFGDGYIEVSVRTRVGFVPLRVRVHLRPEIVEGKLVLRVDKMKAGKLGLPGHFRKQLETRLGEMITQHLRGSGVTLNQVEVRPGELIVTTSFAPE